jgi:hypothetical protein
VITRESFIFDMSLSDSQESFLSSVDKVLISSFFYCVFSSFRQTLQKWNSSSNLAYPSVCFRYVSNHLHHVCVPSFIRNCSSFPEFFRIAAEHFCVISWSCDYAPLTSLFFSTDNKGSGALQSNDFLCEEVAISFSHQFAKRELQSILTHQYFEEMIQEMKLYGSDVSDYVELSPADYFRYPVFRSGANTAIASTSHVFNCIRKLLSEQLFSDRRTTLGNFVYGWKSFLINLITRCSQLKGFTINHLFTSERIPVSVSNQRDDEKRISFLSLLQLISCFEGILLVIQDYSGESIPRQRDIIICIPDLSLHHAVLEYLMTTLDQAQTGRTSLFSVRIVSSSLAENNCSFQFHDIWNLL